MPDILVFRRHTASWLLQSEVSPLSPIPYNEVNLSLKNGCIPAEMGLN